MRLNPSLSDPAGIRDSRPSRGIFKSLNVINYFRIYFDKTFKMVKILKTLIVTLIK